MAGTEQAATQLDVEMMFIGDAELSSGSGSDDEPISSLPKRGGDAKCKAKYKVGTRIKKRFPGHGMFEGVVTSFDGHHYRVDYVDGDRGDMSEEEFELSDVELLDEEPVKLTPFVRKYPSQSSLAFEGTIGNLGSTPARGAAAFAARGSRPLKKRRPSEESHNTYVLEEGEKVSQESGKAKKKKKSQGKEKDRSSQEKRRPSEETLNAYVLKEGGKVSKKLGNRSILGKPRAALQDEGKVKNRGKGDKQESKKATRQEAEEVNKVAMSTEMKDSGMFQEPGERTAQTGNPSPKARNIQGRKEDERDSQRKSKKPSKTLEATEPAKKKRKKGVSRLLRELADYNAVSVTDNGKPNEEKKRKKGGSRLLRELTDYNAVGVADDGKPNDEMTRSRRRGRNDTQEEEKPQASSPPNEGNGGTNTKQPLLDKDLAKTTSPQLIVASDAEEAPASNKGPETTREKTQQSGCEQGHAKVLKRKPETAPGKKQGKTGGREGKAKTTASNPVTPCGKQQSAGEGKTTNGHHSKKEDATTGTKKKKKGSRLLKELADHNIKPPKRDNGKHRLTITAALSAPLEDEFVAPKIAAPEEKKDEAMEEKRIESGATQAAPVTPDKTPNAIVPTPSNALANAPPANPPSSKPAAPKTSKTPKSNTSTSNTSSSKSALAKSAPPKEKTSKTKAPSLKSAPAKSSKAPKYQVGTLFLKSFGEQRYGGSIVGFAGRYYKVRYPQDGDEEELSDNDFDGSDIEIFPTNGDDGYDTDDTKSETDSGRKGHDDMSLLEEEDFSDDENEIYCRIITVSNNAPLKKGLKRDRPENGEQPTSPKPKTKRMGSPKLQTSITEESFKIPRRKKKSEFSKPSTNIRAVSVDFKIPRRNKKSDSES